MEWQPITSAPKDGSQFLAWTISRGWYAPAPSYQVEKAWWSRDHFASESGAIPTHWMPLPEPPVA